MAGGGDFQVPGLSLNENVAGSPLHFLLVTFSVVFFLSRNLREREILLYILLIILAFLLLCFYLKWQIWHARLHLTLFVLAAPLVGFHMSRIRNGRIANLTLVLPMVMALPCLIRNSARPVIGQDGIFKKSRVEQYFTNNPALAGPYTEAAQFISERICSDIGLEIGWDDWEYPLWFLLRENGHSAVRLEHVNVVNISRQMQDENHLGSFSPCAIFSDNVSPPDVISFYDIIYLRKWSSGSIIVYTRISSP